MDDLGVQNGSSILTISSTCGTSGTLYGVGDSISVGNAYGVPMGPVLYGLGENIISNNIKENNMRGLFIVYIVDYKKSKVLFVSEPLIADNEQKVQMKALQAWGGDVDLDDLDILVQRIGNVRAKKEVSEVRIAK